MISQEIYESQKDFIFITKIIPYIQLARLHRPIPIFMLLWPCFIGLAISRGSIFDYMIFFVGTVALRSAGCVINDIVDQKFDSKVERTKIRPLAAKVLTTKQAIAITVFFLGIGLIVWFYLSESAKLLSLLGLLMMTIYPFTKRFTNWPQLFLGLTFNLGLVVAIANTGNFNWKVLSLFFSLVIWTIFYDTIYAFADIKDDLKIGVKSTAIVMQSSPKVWLTVCNCLLHILLFVFLISEGWICLIPLCIGFLYLQVLLNSCDLSNPQNCIKTFGNCHFFGLFLWLWIEFVRVITP